MKTVVMQYYEPYEQTVFNGGFDFRFSKPPFLGLRKPRDSRVVPWKL